MPTSRFHIELVPNEEIPKLVELIVPTFAIYSVERVLGNDGTPESVKAATGRHLHAAKQYTDETGRLCAVKCIDTASGALSACAYWLVYPRPRSREDTLKGQYLASASWLPDGERKDAALRAMRPVAEKQAKWTMGRPFALLMYMATDPAWRRKGAATAVVQWGLDVCAEMGIMAYLEASPQGAPVYEKLGFEVMDQVECEVDGEVATFPAMIRWPPGTKEEDKRTAQG